jgi:hypothetical protein
VGRFEESADSERHVRRSRQFCHCRTSAALALHPEEMIDQQPQTSEGKNWAAPDVEN